ncbi:hypothetical protein G3I60_41005 [Streptomyces sp. SID13666]|uniref:hypothetical protein n=1 Tax=unclassified Streptomyces TaxID=2593676 RepID=UPI0013C1FCA8|nr:MULTISPECIES: hypothetical protein [unclassified Streptomyces]NEA60378.1 hypothetical protein [Streptomyces sp. SID13666]NEA76760.1 hypothetical protein [Streptomyces sp. SID13588]
MADWAERKIIGDQHEHTVKHALEDHGWTVHPCGQGTYPTPIQRALCRTESALRHFPDLLAARGTELVAIDAKTRMPSTISHRYAISRRCALAGLQFMAANAPVPLYYVLGDLRVLTPAEVLYDAFHTLRPTGGSYHLVSSRLARPFDDIFGSTPYQRAA